MRAMRSGDIFCEVIDNFGDAGVCWRLARALAAAGLRVTLWIDDLVRLQRLRPAIKVQLEVQALDGFTLRRWSADAAAGSDLVISAFGCRLPDSTLQHMAAARPAPVWINLEYLSAERWVEDSHRLPSPHPRLPLVQHFYFPGFTPRTGGLLREAGLLDARDAFGAPQRAEWLAQLGVTVPEGARLVSLFCYPSAPVGALLQAMRDGPPVICLVPDGVTPLAPAPGQVRSDGALTLMGVPFLEPDAYDRLLWSCDLNFVRGEDSAVRAQWATQPFVWQFYAQAEDAHWDKLDAFLALYAPLLGASAPAVTAFWRAWNGDSAAALDWPGLLAALPALSSHGHAWRQQLSTSSDLVTGLIEFAGEIG